MALNSRKWGYVRIITGTILGGVLGFYVMHRLEVSYKEKMKERLREYEKELKKKEDLKHLDESTRLINKKMGLVESNDSVEELGIPLNSQATRF